MDQRYSKAQFASILGIIANLLLAIIKGVAGVLTNSKALIADAFHSASDVVSSFAVLIGIRAARKPPDPEHPYGHGKAENIATLIVSILLIIVGFEILLDSVQSIWDRTTQQTSIYALYVVIFLSSLKKPYSSINIDSEIKSTVLRSLLTHGITDQTPCLQSLL